MTGNKKKYIYRTSDLKNPEQILNERVFLSKTFLFELKTLRFKNY